MKQWKELMKTIYFSQGCHAFIKDLHECTYNIAFFQCFLSLLYVKLDSLDEKWGEMLFISY